MKLKQLVLISIFSISTTQTMDQSKQKLKPKEYRVTNMNTLVPFNGEKKSLTELIKDPDFQETPIFEFTKNLRFISFVKNIAQITQTNIEEMRCSYITDLELFIHTRKTIKLGAIFYFTYEKLDLCIDPKSLIKLYYKKNPDFRNNLSEQKLISELTNSQNQTKSSSKKKYSLNPLKGMTSKIEIEANHSYIKI